MGHYGSCYDDQPYYPTQEESMREDIKILEEKVKTLEEKIKGFEDKFQEMEEVIRKKPSQDKVSFYKLRKGLL